jgi:polar amino acid transport system substrate-binding protein
MREGVNRRRYAQTIGAVVFAGSVTGCVSDGREGVGDADDGNAGASGSGGGDANGDGDGEASGDGNSGGESGDDDGDGGGDDKGGDDGDETTENTSETGDEIPLVTGADAAFEPFTVGNSPEEITGFDIEVLETVIAEAPGYVHDEWGIVTEDWPEEFFEAVEAGKADVMTGAVTITEERTEKWDIAFTDPYYIVNQAILVQSGSGFTPTNPEELAGHTVVVKSGTTSQEVAQAFVEDGILDESAIQTVDDAKDVVEEVESGAADAGIIDGPVGASYAKDNDVEVAFDYETGEEYGFVVAAGREELLSALNRGIETLRNNESLYAGLTSKWLG